MYDIGLVDSTGIFLSTVDESTIARYCGEEESLAHYLNTAYSIQKYIHDLSDKEMGFWCHKLSELCLRLSIQNLTHCNSYTYNQIFMNIHQLVRYYGEHEVNSVVRLLTDKNKKVSGSLLLQSVEKCASK